MVKFSKGVTVAVCANSGIPTDLLVDIAKTIRDAAAGMVIDANYDQY